MKRQLEGALRMGRNQLEQIRFHWTFYINAPQKASQIFPGFHRSSQLRIRIGRKGEPGDMSSLPGIFGQLFGTVQHTDKTEINTNSAQGVF